MGCQQVVDMDDPADQVALLCDGFEALIRSAPTAAQPRLLKLLLDNLDSLLADDRRRYDYPIFNKIGEYISSSDMNRRLFPSFVWEWLRNIVRRADGPRQIAISICIFEYLVDAPIDWEDDSEWETVGPLFQLWTEPATRWAICGAYSNKNRRLKRDFVRFLEEYTRRGRALPSPVNGQETGRIGNGDATC
jgi:hypothetical protein